MEQTIPTVEAAIASPADFEVHYNILGWGLSECDSKLTLLITEEQAQKVIAAIKESNK